MTNFEYLNLNPLSREEEDCVCRAILLATEEKSYEKVLEKLNLIADLYECDTLCCCCYKHLLDDYYKLPRMKISKPITIKEFLKAHRKGTYLIRVDGHLTCAINGKIYDLWDCTYEIIDIVWKVIK